MAGPFLRIAVPSPLRTALDYLPPEEGDASALAPGMRLRVPFGRSSRIGMLLSIEDAPSTQRPLKAAIEVLDASPLLGQDDLALLSWASRYYHHPIGEVIFCALPTALRKGALPKSKAIPHYRLTEAGRGVDPASLLTKAPRQASLLSRLKDHPEGTTLAPGEGEVARRLLAKGWVEVCQAPLKASPHPPLYAHQRACVEAVSQDIGFQSFLLEGVTGSGKTEVYLRLAERAIAQGKQAMVLLPEIGLTGQMVARFERLGVPMAVFHSGLSEGERLDAWLRAKEGEAKVVIGTRSAVFIPLKHPGLFIVDEEHDLSHKQQEGFRYSARDVAVFRARQHQVPVVLGSATPSLESLYNARGGRYRHLFLPERVGAASMPAMALLDVRRKAMEGGLSEPFLKAMVDPLARGEQVLLFLNRRGYAPCLICHECGWVSQCVRCDARLTFHQGERCLRCHHCGIEQPVPMQCPACGSFDLRPLGQGTERLEEVLKARFPEKRVVRIDRDTTRRKGAFSRFLDTIHRGDADILIGTQMLAKGHHFPNVTLVGIVDADQGLFSADFRAPERMAQLIVQVAGRAGRAEKPGKVLIQTHQPEHPLLQRLIRQDYRAFAEAALEERAQAQLPPFVHLALLRAEALDKERPLAFLAQAKAYLGEAQGVQVLGPVPSPMERRAGFFRAQLWIQADRRVQLHRFLGEGIPKLASIRGSRKVRWSLDVDPMEIF